MIRGLYLAATALEQETKKLDVISNNLANIKTIGYKKDEALTEEFASKLLLKSGGYSKTFLNNIKPNVKMTKEDDIYLLETKKGFFRVNSLGGDSYSTSLKFRVDDNGYLRTPYKNENHKIIDEYGYKVIGQNGFIKLENFNKDSDLKIDEFGNLFLNGEKIDNLLYSQDLNVIGTISGGIKFNRTYVDYSQGSFMSTENPFDLALTGEGFFVVNSPSGTLYTRNGEFKLTPEGKLVTSDGFAVKGMNDEIIIEDVEHANDLFINEYGELIMQGRIIDKLEIVNLDNLHNLKKFGNNFYKYEGEIKDLGFEGRVVQGYLEESNVDSVTEMVKMISNYRHYETAQRVLRTYDELLGMSVNQIAKI